MRSEKQKQKAQEWDKGFIIHSGPMQKETHFPEDIAATNKRRRVDEIQAELRRKRALREVWEGDE